ncbi:MAG TPA: hypothetical protein VM367_05785 [Pseudonocardia sp.]|jgi:hypothetical protein|nr:hypothetical protein [Pseudonocardia sp.]
MNADETDRTQLREMLLDDVALPSATVREMMFERTFASPPGAGQELLPPDGLFDLSPDEVTDDDLWDGDGGDRPGGVAGNDGTAVHDDPFAHDAGPAPDDQPGLTQPDPDPGEPAGHDQGDDGDTSSGDPITDW